MTAAPEAASRDRGAVPRLVLAGIAYAAAAVAITAIADRAGTPQPQRPWRLAAWVAGAIIYAVHFGIEFPRTGRRARVTALRVAAGAALGGLGLAISACLHSRRPIWAALLIWPLLTGVPALLVTWPGAALLAGLRRRR